MSRVLVLASDDAFVDELRPHLVEHELLVPSPARAAADPIPDCDLVILDESFSEDGGLTFLKGRPTKPDVPVVVLVAPETASVASEALALGAFNFLIKVREYTALLDCVVRTTLWRTAERREMLGTLEILQKKVDALALSAAPASEAPVAALATASRRRVIEEIAARLRSGEINLPTRSGIEAELSTAIDRGVGLDEICEIVSQDGPMTAELIRLANSSFFRGAREIGSLAAAVSRLGIAATQNHVSVVCNRALYTPTDPALAPRFLCLWRHGAAVAHVARLTATTLGSDGDLAFTSGLLHDIGHLLLLQIDADLARTGGAELTLDSAAREALIAASHSEFGSVLLTRWKIPDAITAAIAMHHHASENAPPLTGILQFADQLALDLGFDYGVPMAPAISLADAGTALDLTAEAVATLREQARDLLASIHDDAPAT